MAENNFVGFDLDSWMKQQQDSFLNSRFGLNSDGQLDILGQKADLGNMDLNLNLGGGDEGSFWNKLGLTTSEGNLNWDTISDFGKLGLGLYQLMQGRDAEKRLQKRNDQQFETMRFNSAEQANSLNNRMDNLSALREAEGSTMNFNPQRALSFDEWRNGASRSAPIQNTNQRTPAPTGGNPMRRRDFNFGGGTYA